MATCLSDCLQKQEGVKVRQQESHQKQDRSNNIWGWTKFHNKFDDLIDDLSWICPQKQRIVKICVKKNISFQDLLSTVKELLEAPESLTHGYTLFLRHDSCFKNKQLFAGEFLTPKNVDRLMNGFLIDLMPSPIYYVRSLISRYKEDEDAATARQIFQTLEHPTFLFHLKNEFGFCSFVIFLLSWLSKAGESWPWHKWHFHSLLCWATDDDWRGIDETEELHELLVMNTCNNIVNGTSSLLDFCLELSTWFCNKCSKLRSKLLKFVNIQFIADQLPKAVASNYLYLISLFVAVHTNADEKAQQMIEKTLDQPVFAAFLASLVLENNVKFNSQLEKSLFQVQQIRFAEIRRLLNTSVSFEDLADLNCLIQANYRDQAVNDVADLILATAPPGYYLYEGIYSAINGDVDVQLLELLTNKQMSMYTFVRMATSVFNSVFESLSAREYPFEPEYHPLLVSESNPIAWMYKNGCLLFKDIWLSDKMRTVELDLRFYKTSQLIGTLFKNIMETKPTTLGEWSDKLQQSFMVKWFLCSDVDDSKSSIEGEKRDDEWEKCIRKTMTRSIQEIVRRKYINYLHQGFEFKKYIKSPSGNHVDTCQRKWILDRSEIAFRVHDSEPASKLKSRRDENDDDDSPELILGIKSITRIIQGDEYLEKCKMLFPSKKRIFRKDKNPKLLNGIFIETTSDEHEILYDNAEEFQKFITALNIIRFNKYPKSEVEKLLDYEVKIRLLNLKNIEKSADQEDDDDFELPQLPVI